MLISLCLSIFFHSEPFVEILQDSQRLERCMIRLLKEMSSLMIVGLSVSSELISVNSWILHFACLVFLDAFELAAPEFVRC